MSRWIIATSARALGRLARETKHIRLATRRSKAALPPVAVRGMSSGGPGLRTRESPEEGIVVLSPFSETRKLPRMTLTELLWQRLSEWGDRAAVTCSVTGLSYTYKQVRDMCRIFSRSLLAPTEDGGLGLRPNDVIALLMYNSPDYPIVFHGSVEAGITVSTVNPSFTAGEVARQLNVSNAKVLVTTVDSLSTAKEALKEVQSCKRIVVVDSTTTTEDLKGCISYQELFSRFSSQSVSVPKEPIDLESTVVLPFSSGTEGLPKGVVLSHSNVVSSICMIDHPDILTFFDEDSSEQEVCLAVLPLYHIFGMNAIMNLNMYLGRHLIVVPKFEAKSFISTIKKYKPTVVYLVPPLLLFLAKHPDITKEDLDSIKQVICGAAPATKTIIDSFLERAGRRDVDFREGYGLTESSAVATILPRWAGRSKVGSCGCLAPHTEARIIDGSGKGVGAFSKGELSIRGPQVMKGYLNNEAATKKTIDSQRWLLTGDIAYFDEEGYFYIVDRIKELIKVKGNQVSPTELEEVVHLCPGVADVAVVGIPDLKAGELPAAFVIRTDDEEGRKLTAEDIRKWMLTRVAHFKQLSGGIRFIDSIPKSASGKVQRRDLLKMVEQEKIQN